MQGTAWIPSPGELIGDRYELGEEIGRGGMGVVHAGLDTRLSRPVALKFLDPDLVGDQEALGRFKREALTAGRLGHENICDVRDHGTTASGTPYIVMELLDGQPLSRLLATAGRLLPRDAIEIVLQVLSALEAAHAAGIVHRDLKPENVFLTEGPGGRRRVKLVDFGISKFVGDDSGLRLTKTGVVMGSPFFMSPEQARGQEDIDQRSDLWSVGVILFELLTGDLPYKGANYNEVMVRIVTEKPPRPRAVVPELPEALEAVVLEALEPDREARIASASELAAALETCLDALDDEPAPGAGLRRGTPLPVSVGSFAGRRSGRQRRRGIAVVGVIGVVVALGAIAGVALTVGSGRERRASTAAPAASAPADAPAPVQPGPRPEPVPVPAPSGQPRAHVTLVGLPEGARVTFRGVEVAGGELVGPAGQTGTLEVLVPSASRPLTIDVELVAGGEVDVGGALARFVAETRAAERRRDAGAPGRPPPASSAEPDAGPPPGERYLQGTAGAQLDTSYGGP